MLIPRSPAKLSLLLLLGSLPAAIGSCAYNWALVSEQPVDAGAQDATADSPASDVATADTSPPPMTDAGVDAALVDSSTTPCAHLGATLDTDRNEAKACSGPDSEQCATWVTDECGCLSYVAEPDAATTRAFAAAIAAFEEAGCPPTCSDGGCVEEGVGACLPVPPAGVTYACN